MHKLINVINHINGTYWQKSYDHVNRLKKKPFDKIQHALMIRFLENVRLEGTGLIKAI